MQKESNSSNQRNSKLDDDLKLIVTKKVTLNKELASEIKKRANSKCEYCGQETFLKIHHIEFLSNGGKDHKKII